MTAANRYAKALFALAGESSQLPAVTAAAASLKAALAEPSIQATLANPRLTIAERTQLAQGMAKAVKAPAPLANTLSVLAANNRLSVVEEVLAAYQTFADAVSGITSVKVSSAAALTDAQRTKLISMVKAHTKATEIRLEETTDSTLQGGFRALFNGMVWDASLSGSLSRLSTRLKAAITQR